MKTALISYMKISSSSNKKKTKVKSSVKQSTDPTPFDSKSKISSSIRKYEQSLATLCQLTAKKGVQIRPCNFVVVAACYTNMYANGPLCCNVEAINGRSLVVAEVALSCFAAAGVTSRSRVSC